MINKKIINFYKQTSLYTDLGLYKNFAKQLTEDIDELCVLQRMQIIHPVSVNQEDIINQKNKNTNICVTRMKYEDDLYPTAISMISELIRKDRNYSINRKLEDMIHVTCRGQAILLASILKAKGYSARVRSGFATYIRDVNCDHWIVEYYHEKQKRWILVDPDMHCSEVNFDLNDMPKNKFIFGAEAYLGIRNNKYKSEEITYDSDPITLGLKASLRGLFYDFHALMNDEIIFLHMPKYIQEKNFNLSEEEYEELDKLASLLLNPDENFDELLKIWNSNTKYRIMSGALNS